MFINKSQDGSNNVCGLDIDKNAIQRIECGKRFVTDIELVQLAKVLRVEISRLVQ